MSILWQCSRKHLGYFHLPAVYAKTGEQYHPVWRKIRHIESANKRDSTPITDPKTGEIYPTEGFQLWILHVAIHRNPQLFPDPHKFRPERFLQPELAAQKENAWRPFERGPRNCIGQELALLEVKIVMVLVVRRLRVQAAYDELAELPNEKDGMEWSSYANEAESRKTVWGEAAYQTLRGTAKPRQGLPARVSFR